MGACHVHWPRKVVALMRLSSVVIWITLFVLSLCSLKAPFVLTDTSVLPPVCSSPSPHLFAHSKHLNHSMCLEHLERMGHLKKTTVFLPKHFPSLRVARQCFFLSARLIALPPALCSRTLSLTMFAITASPRRFFTSTSLFFSFSFWFHLIG